MLPSSVLRSVWSHFQNTMHLYMFLACVLWGLESHCVPMKITSASTHDNYRKVCAEIWKELSVDDIMYNGTFKRPQNTSEEPCYGQFTKDFICTLEELKNSNQQDVHIQKVYKGMKTLAQICSKLTPTVPSKKCITERSNFTEFKKALQHVVISIEGWQSCETIKGNLWEPAFSLKPGACV